MATKLKKMISFFLEQFLCLSVCRVWQQWALLSRNSAVDLMTRCPPAEWGVRDGSLLFLFGLYRWLNNWYSSGCPVRCHPVRCHPVRCHPVRCHPFRCHHVALSGVTIWPHQVSHCQVSPCQVSTCQVSLRHPVRRHPVRCHHVRCHHVTLSGVTLSGAGITWSVQGLVGPVSVHCNWVK